MYIPSNSSLFFNIFFLLFPFGETTMCIIIRRKKNHKKMDASCRYNFPLYFVFVHPLFIKQWINNSPAPAERGAQALSSHETEKKSASPIRHRGRVKPKSPEFFFFFLLQVLCLVIFFFSSCVRSLVFLAGVKVAFKLCIVYPLFTL